MKKKKKKIYFYFDVSPFFIATILAKLLSGKYIFSTILTPVRKNTHTYENIFPLV